MVLHGVLLLVSGCIISDFDFGGVMVNVQNGLRERASGSIKSIIVPPSPLL